MDRPSLRAAVRVSAIYIAAAGLWIVFSDKLVGVLFSDPPGILAAQTVKGTGFVLFTGLMLFLLVRREVHKLAESQQQTQHLNERLQRRNDELTALHRVSIALGATLDIDEICRVMFREVAQKLLNAPHFSVGLFDAEAQVINRQFTIENGVEIDSAQFPPVPLGTDPMSETVRTRQHRVLNIVTGAGGQQQPRTALFVPLIGAGGDKVLGVMVLQHDDANAFLRVDMTLFNTLTSQMVLALENALLFNQVHNHASELEQRVTERTAELTLANTHLKELDQLKSKFIADVTHDLRSPVTALTMRIDLLERVAPEKREKYIVGLKEQILTLKKLVEDVLDISQLDMMESVGTTLLPVDLNTVVEHVVSTYRPVAVNAGLDLIFEPEPALSSVMGEFNLLSRMIGNLIANAINYTSDGEIRINTRREAEADRVCVEIADTGIGIQPEDLPYLFKRFYRGKQTVSSNPPGTGLGLSIVKEVVDMHGGSIQVDSQPGAGTRFTIYLPSIPHFPPATDETDIA